MTVGLRQSICKSYRPARKGEEGLTLLEVLVALGILAAVAVVFLLGMTTSSKAIMVSQEMVSAESLAKSQLEIVKSWEYDDVNDPPNYTAAKMTGIPTGYDITITAERMDPNGDGTDTDDGMQRITIIITRDGGQILDLVGYKVK